MSLVNNADNPQVDFIDFNGQTDEPNGFMEGTLWYAEPQDYTGQNGLMLRTDDVFRQAIPNMIEGNYGPTIGDGTNNFTTSTAAGYYCKIGRMVHVDIRLQWTSKGSAVSGSTLKISLPFQSSTSSNRRSCIMVTYITGTGIVGYYQIIGRATGTDEMNIVASRTSTTGVNFTCGQMPTAGELDLNGSYVAEE